MAGVLDPRSPFFGSLSASYATTVSAPSPTLSSVQWLTFGVGGGVAAPIPLLNALVRTRIEGVLDGVTVSARTATKPPSPAAPEPPAPDPAAPEPPAPDSTALGPGTTWGFAARTALDFVWPADTSVALVGGVDMFLRLDRIESQAPPKPETQLPMGGFTGMLGVQLRLH